MKYLIDTNIFLHAALEQDKEQKCRKFLDEVSSGEIEAAVTLFHMDASAIIMENRGISEEDIAKFYFEAYSGQGLEIVNLGISTRLNALADNSHSGLDDGLISQAFKELDVKKIVTYDQDFEEKRVTPEDIIEDTTS